jgi:hypothetical protein
MVKAKTSAITDKIIEILFMRLSLSLAQQIYELELTGAN